MLQNSFYAISGTFYTLLDNTDLYLSIFILSYVFLGHNDSVEWGLTVALIFEIYLHTFSSTNVIVTFTLITVKCVHIRSTTVTSIKITRSDIISIITYSIPSKLRFLTFWKYLWDLENSTEWLWYFCHLVCFLSFFLLFLLKYQHFFSIISTHQS